MKKLISFAVMIMTAFMCISSAASAEGVSVAPTDVDTSVRVYDYAELMTDDEEDSLRQEISDIESEVGYTIVVVTTDVNSSSAMVYADDFFDYNHFGTDGILYLIDMDNRKMWISTTGSCIDYYTDSKIDSILDKTYDKVSNEEYYESAEEFLTSVKNNGTSTASAIRSKYFYLPDIVDLAVGLIVGLITVAILLLRHKTVSKATSAERYISSDGFEVVDRNVVFIGSHTSSHHIDTSGGSSTHTGSSGTSHGGGGRSF